MAHAPQVATQRVKTAVKAEIPHVDDPVGKLANVGAQTREKLLDIESAAAAAGVFDLHPPENTVTTGNE
jgi:hypothetical protein